MKFSELCDSGAAIGELQTFLVRGEAVPVSVRIPENLRDAAREAAELTGMSFTSYVKMCLVERLVGRGR